MVLNSLWRVCSGTVVWNHHFGAAALGDSKGKDLLDILSCVETSY
jgi:hypothetical protein